MRRVVLAALVLGLAASGCYSKATAYGGKFTVAYASMVDTDNFVKPIAPGATLEVVAWANGTTDGLAISEARSNKPNIVAIEKVKDKAVVLKGIAEGTAEIEITAKDASGNELVDKMFFHVRKPSTHGIEHSCTEEPNAAYVRGEEIDVFHSMQTSEKRHVVGGEYAPFVVEPSGALKLVQQPQAGGYYGFKAPKANDQVTLRSTIDQKTLTFKVVEAKSLTTATLYVNDRMLEGREEWAFAMVQLPGVTLCSQSALTKAKSLTPSICKVRATLDEEPEDDSNRAQIAIITPLKFGICKYEVTLPELNGGKGITLKGEAKVGRLQFPGEGTNEVADRFTTWIGPATVAVVIRDSVAALGFALWFVRRRRRALKGT